MPVFFVSSYSTSISIPSAEHVPISTALDER
jgi:hypothetical protein